MTHVKSFLLSVLCGVSATALAGPVEIGGSDGVQVLDAARTGHVCAGHGAICFSSGALGTLAERVAGEKATVLARAAAVAAKGVAPDGDRSRPWSIELDAALARPAAAGNTLFIFYDLADAGAIARHEVTAMHQARVPAGRAVAARIQLFPEDGFSAGHTYRAQIVQLIGGREVILAQGDFALR